MWRGRAMAGKDCIVCGGTESTIVFRELDVDMLRCSRCGHVFSSHEAEQTYDGYFGYDLEAIGDTFWWDKAHEKMCGDFCRKFIAGKSGRLLDIGCGIGYFVKKMEEYPSWEVHGYEVSPVAAAIARNKLGLDNVVHGDVLDSDFGQHSFDIVTMWDVIEHIPDPDPVLSFVNYILKDEGFLFLHTPNVKIQLPKAKLKRMLRGYRSNLHYLEARDHVNLYSMSTLRTILERNHLGNVSFIHLKPIQSVSGGKSRLLILAKNLWYYFAVAMYHGTAGKVNLDNLFVVAAGSRRHQPDIYHLSKAGC